MFSTFTRDKVEYAIRIAKRAHAGQLYDDRDYITAHIIPVMDELRKHHASNITLIIGALHDVLEDTTFTYDEIKKEFGQFVADAVDILSKKKDEEYFDYIRRLSIVDICKEVKLADLACNYRESVQKGIVYRSLTDRYVKAILILLGYAD